MTRPPIYHLRCNLCHTSYLSVSHDFQAVCFACDQVDWQVLCVWTRDRTPWVDAPRDYVERLFPIETPAGFLASLPRAALSDQKYHALGTAFAAPGLSRTRTRHHTPWCPTHTDRFAPCDPACREEVTYARVAAAHN